MKHYKTFMLVFFLAVSLTTLITSCEKKKIALKQTIYTGEWIRQRAQNCNLHDSIFLDTPDGILFQPLSTNTLNRSAYAENDYYELTIEVYSFMNSNTVYNVEYTSGSPLTGNIIIEINDKITGERFMAYSGTAIFTYKGISTGDINFCNVLFKNVNGNGSYKGTGYIYVDY